MDALQLYILTFNCARNFIDIDHFSRHFFDALPPEDNSSSTTPPELIVLCLQEIAPIAYAFLGGSFLTPYFVPFAKAVDRATARRWGPQYINVLTDNSGMTGLMVFARSDVVDHLSSPNIARVGFGFLEMGNKGAVGARLSYNSPTSPRTGVDLTLVAAHLAPAEDAFIRRNADWRSIVERLVFDGSEITESRNDEYGGQSESAGLLGTSTSDLYDSDQGIFTPTTYLFLGGDLNYRTSDTLPEKEDSSQFPQPEAEPTSPLHYSHLLKHDQLRREMQQSQCFHGLSEAPITFPPTYKYSPEAQQAAARDTNQADKATEWKWANTRWPSWCDRVLYLDAPPEFGDQAKVKVLRYDALPVFPTSDHRAVALTVSVPISTRRPQDAPRIAAPIAPFPIDPQWERKRDAARRREFLVGCLAYLGLTWEGNFLVLASAIGVFGAWFVVRSFLNY